LEKQDRNQRIPARERKKYNALSGQEKKSRGARRENTGYLSERGVNKKKKGKYYPKKCQLKI